MSMTFRAAVLAAIMITLQPRAALSQRVTAEILQLRVDSLQRRVSELERRIADLESRSKVGPASPQVLSTTPDARDIATWRRLRDGMSMDAVRKLLGEPVHISGGTVAHWYYPNGGTVGFISGRLTSWNEPSR